MHHYVEEGIIFLSGAWLGETDSDSKGFTLNAECKTMMASHCNHVSVGKERTNWNYTSTGRELIKTLRTTS